MADIVVVGSINTDMVVRALQLPRAGETVLGGDFTQGAGGKGANQAVAAARAGAAVAMVGCVGDDQRGRDAVDGLRREGVEVSQIHRLSEAASGVALIVVDADGQNCIAVAPGANACLTPAMMHHAEPLLAAAEVARREGLEDRLRNGSGIQDGRLLLMFTMRTAVPPNVPPLGVHAVVGKETSDGFQFDFHRDRIVISDKTPVGALSGGGFGPTVQLKDGTLVTAYSYRKADEKTYLEVARWRLE